MLFVYTRKGSLPQYHRKQVNMEQNTHQMYTLCSCLSNASNNRHSTCQAATYYTIILEWTTSLDTSFRTLFVCRGPGAGDCVQRDLSPTFLRRRHHVRRWLSYSHWQAYIHYAFIRQMASFLVSDSLTLGV